MPHWKNQSAGRCLPHLGEKSGSTFFDAVMTVMLRCACGISLCVPQYDSVIPMGKLAGDVEAQAFLRSFAVGKTEMVTHC